VAEQNEGDTDPIPAAPVPLFYANGFNLAASLSDFGLDLMYDGHRVARVALSFTTAKTLASHLAKSIGAFEAVTGHTLMTMEDVSKGLEGDQSEPVSQ
jgi:hypothetical protein